MRGSPVLATCSCGRTYTRRQWLALPLVGVQKDHHGHPALSCRNCTCGSTRTVDVELDPETAPLNVFRRKLEALVRVALVHAHGGGTAEDWTVVACELADLALEAQTNADRVSRRG
jgi:hypothetical protein